MDPKKSVLLISDCCGKGFYQATALIKALNEQGLTYNMNVSKSKHCVQVLEKFGIDPKTVRRKPYIFIDDILIPAEKINDKDFVNHLIEQLKATNPEFHSKIVKKDTPNG